MTDIIKIIGVGLLAVIIINILKEYQKEYVIYVVLIAGGIIAYYSIQNLASVIQLIERFFNRTEYNPFIKILLKLTGISLLTEYAVSICKDSGENAIANKIDFGGKIIIISLSIPIISQTMESLLKLLP